MPCIETAPLAQPHSPRALAPASRQPASLDKVVEQDVVQVTATQVAVPRIRQHLQLALLQRNHAHLRQTQTGAQPYVLIGELLGMGGLRQLIPPMLPGPQPISKTYRPRKCKHPLPRPAGFDPPASHQPGQPDSLLQARAGNSRRPPPTHSNLPGPTCVDEKPMSTNTTLTGSPSGRSVL